MSQQKKFGYVAIIGPTNAGKSTLMNALVGVPLASVSHKVQTTSRCISGICMYQDTQLAFIDTPGFFVATGKTHVQSHIMRYISHGVEEASAVLAIVDGQRPVNERFLQCVRRLELKVPCILVINKVDAMTNKTDLLPLIASYDASGLFQKTFLISARKHNGLDDVVHALTECVPEGVWMYDADAMTTLSGKELAVEVIKGAIFARFNKEIPYTTNAVVRSWRRGEKGHVYVCVDIEVGQKSHKQILIGEQGCGVAYVRQRAEKHFKRIMGVDTHFSLNVVVRAS